MLFYIAFIDELFNAITKRQPLGLSAQRLGKAERGSLVPRGQLRWLAERDRAPQFIFFSKLSIISLDVVSSPFTARLAPK